MTKFLKKEILYSHDFENPMLGPIEFNGHKEKTKSDFYEVSPKVYHKLNELNNKLKNISQANGQTFADFLLNLTKAQYEIAQLGFKHFPDIGKLHISNKNGRGLEVGVEVQLKEKFQKVKKNKK